MKMTSLFKMSILAAGMIVALGANAAESGTLTVAGSVISGACSIDAASIAAPVDLGTVDPSALATEVGAISSKTAFNIHLTDCPSGIESVKFTATGAADATNNQLLGLASGSEASGFGIAIYDDANTLVPMQTMSKQYTVNTDTGEANIALQAAAMSTSTSVVAGQFSAMTNFGISYN